MKKWILILLPSETEEENEFIFRLQEIEYDSPDSFEAIDREAAIIHADKILGVYPEHIKY